MGICYYCGKEVDLPYRCSYCNLSFCNDHRLPENHNCVNQPGRRRDEKNAKGLLSTTSRKSMLRNSKETEKTLTPRSNWEETTRRWREEGEMRRGEKVSRFITVKKGIIYLMKFLGFLTFTTITAIPSVMYIYLLTVPEMGEIIGFMYIFASNALLQYIIPNLAYFIVWFFIVYKILRKKCVWWYHLVLLGVSLINWWSIGRLITISNFLAQLFEGVTI